LLHHNIKISHKNILNYSPTYIIAEAGVNHNGSEKLSLEMVSLASKAGADAIKFQTFDTNKLVSKDAKSATYQLKSSNEPNQFSMLKKLELPRESLLKIFEKCQDLNIEFLSTPFDIDLAHFLVELGMKKIKIPSGEITNLTFIRELASFNLPIILSTGMSSIAEVHDAVSEIKKLRKIKKFNQPLDEMLTILHCTSNYPAKYEDVNLKAIQTLKSEFSIPVGYSDHTPGTDVAPLAVAIGAKVIEKHFTLDKSMIGPDHKASINPEELCLMIKKIKETEICLGNGIKEPRNSELAIKEIVTRSVGLKVDKKKGATLKAEDLILLRPGSGISPAELKKVFGKKINKDSSRGTILFWDDISL
jgi:N,N'-diacetyllegionaminate synthase